jgi:hypothetical protein
MARCAASPECEDALIGLVMKFEGHTVIPRFGVLLLQQRRGRQSALVGREAQIF